MHIVDVGAIETWGMQIVADHYAVKRNGMLIGVVRQTKEGWCYEPLSEGEILYAANVADALRHAAQAAQRW